MREIRYMGTYVNPGNLAFRRILNSKYVDKTELISLMNDRVGGAESLVCVSRPRRFGKSYAAKMLAAYYDCSCDSHELFDDKIISKTEEYEEHLNRYNVICLDISSFVSEAKINQKPLVLVPRMIMEAIHEELRLECPGLSERKTVNDELLACVAQPDGKPFIFIIDEWDALIREAKEDDKAQEAYLNLLRGWFKKPTLPQRS